MAGFVIERGGFSNATTLIGSVVDDMVANGFTLVYPSSFTSGSATAPYRVLLEAGEDVDPLFATQAWRVMFDVQEIQTCFCYVGTSATLKDNGTVPVFKEVVTTTTQSTSVSALKATDVIGNVGYKMAVTSINQSANTNYGPTMTDDGVWSPQTYGETNAAQVDDPQYGLINRRFRISTPELASSAPLRYRLVISPRGFWLGIWEEATSETTGYNYNWVLVQRPVDRETGEVVTTGKAPVWCVSYNAPNQQKPSVQYFHQTVVREADVLKPDGGTTARRRADQNTADSDGIINPMNQVSLSEDMKYIVTFPSRLNTSRYCYSYELDMIGVTSADVVSNGTIVPLTVYGEPNPREYIAMNATNTGNTGARIIVLNSGGGI